MKIGHLIIGWVKLSPAQVRAMELDQDWHWESFDITWRQRGVSIVRRPTKYRFLNQ